MEDHVVPDILHDEVFKAAGLGIDEEAAGVAEGCFPRQAPVGHGHDDGRQPAGANNRVERPDGVLEKRLLVLGEAV
jgi:hypothetical protein